MNLCGSENVSRLVGAIVVYRVKKTSARCWRDSNDCILISGSNIRRGRTSKIKRENKDVAAQRASRPWCADPRGNLWTSKTQVSPPVSRQPWRRPQESEGPSTIPGQLSYSASDANRASIGSSDATDDERAPLAVRQISSIGGRTWNAPPGARSFARRVMRRGTGTQWPWARCGLRQAARSDSAPRYIAQNACTTNKQCRG